MLAGRVEVKGLPVYEAVETGAAAPADWDAVLVHSRRAAVALAGRGDGAGAGRTAIAISAAAAEPLQGPPFADIRIAAAPTEASMLEALGNPRPGV
jgi:uroporphyrinogen-III synthase